MRIGKLEELLQEFQGGAVVRQQSGYGLRRSIRDNGNGDLPLSKSRHGTLVVFHVGCQFW